MSASALLLALAAQQVSIPLGRPRAVERLPASVASAGPAFARACAEAGEQDRPAPPVRLLGNSFYVGSCLRSAVLITGGAAGHVLIDSGSEQSSAWVADNIRSLGFRPEDIRFLLHSNEHPDQIGGHSRLQRLSGAAVVASAASVPTLRSGRLPRRGGTAASLTQLPVDRIVADQETIRLGPLQLTAMTTPGRTPGALSWRWVSCEGAVCRTLVYAAGLRPLGDRLAERQGEVATARASLARLAALKPCDLLVSASPLASRLAERFAKGEALWGEGQCEAYAAQQEASIAERLAGEAAPPR